MLQRGDSVPHFDVRQIDGKGTSYSDVWQHRNLVLVVTGDDESAPVAETVAGLRARASQIVQLDTVTVVTADDVPGVSRPGIVIADRWGEIAHVADRAAWLDATGVIEWLEFLQHKCPECEGEAR